MADATAKTTTKCALLALPAELRLTIYDHYFDTTSYSTGTHIKLEAAAPPLEALALTCRQIHKEYVDLYREACRRRYFTQNRFTINVKTLDWTVTFPDDTSPPHNTLRNLDLLRDCDLENIRHLRLEGPVNRLFLSSQKGGEWVIAVQRPRGLSCRNYSRWAEYVGKRMHKVLKSSREEHGRPANGGLTRMQLTELLAEWDELSFHVERHLR